MASKTKSKTKSKIRNKFSMGKQKLLSILKKKSFTAVLECFWILYSAAPMKLKMRVNVKLEKAGSKPNTRKRLATTKSGLTSQRPFKRKTSKRKAPKRKAAKRKSPKKARTAKQKRADKKNGARLRKFNKSKGRK